LKSSDSEYKKVKLPGFSKDRRSFSELGKIDLAIGPLNSSHMLRVVFEKENGNIVVVTFYPVRRARYEGKL